MNRLRTHIARFITIALVLIGFSLYMVQPVQAEQSNAFTRWLSTMTKSVDGTGLQKELNNLQKSDEQLDKIIEQASQIVSRNNEEFDFAFTESTASQQVYQLLLIEWNQFQTGNAMAAVPIQQTVKVLAPMKLDHVPFEIAILKGSIPGTFYLIEKQSLVSQAFSSVSLIPMVGGIAIGAP